MRVSAWGELRGERPAAGLLRVLVDGQHAGSIGCEDGAWVAQWEERSRRDRPLRRRLSSHGDVQGAVEAVVRSGFARSLGAAASSPVLWSDKARSRAARLERARTREVSA